MKAFCWSSRTPFRVGGSFPRNTHASDPAFLTSEADRPVGDGPVVIVGGEEAEW